MIGPKPDVWVICEGPLYRNDNGRWEFSDCELTSGSGVEIEIDGVWIRGFIESRQGNYYWYSRHDSVVVVLRERMNARICQYGERKRIAM